MDPLKKRNVTIVLLLAVAGMLVFSVYLYTATDQFTGRVDHKSITGVLNDTSYTLLGWMPSGIGVLPAIRDLVPENVTDLSETQLEEIERELQRLGYDLHYVVNIELTSYDKVNGRDPGEAEGYFTSSADFNKVKMGDDVTFDVLHNEKNVIRNLR